MNCSNAATSNRFFSNAANTWEAVQFPKGNRVDTGGHGFSSKSDRVMNWWFQFLRPHILQEPKTADHESHLAGCANSHAHGLGKHGYSGALDFGVP
jgi:hypothetical protein